MAFNMLQGHVGIHLLQPVVLGLQLLQALQIRGFEPAILRLPLIEAGRADAMLPAKILHLTAVLGLLEDRDDLALTETGVPHCHLFHRLRSMMAEVPTHDLSAIWRRQCTV